MKILYTSSLCSVTKFNFLFETARIKPAQQAQKYHRLMVEGLVQNQGILINVLSSVPLNRSMSKKLYQKGELETENGIKFEYLPFLNLPLLRHIGLFTTGFIKALKWCRKGKEGAVVCDVLNISISAGALLASKITRTASVGIVTDVPDFLMSMTPGKNILKSKIICAINTFIMNRFDSYVFLTEQMNELINKEQRPFVVIEGQVDINMATITNSFSNKYDKKVCLYAGALQKIYGLKLLVDAFVAANIAEAELHLYGSGDFEDDLKIIAVEHPNIKYFGVVANDLIVKEQLKASLLINPRPKNEEYTKYSFPSKNMEYMVSGTPILTTCLPGMPEEYKQYVYLIEDESVEGLTNALKSIYSLSREELHKKGHKAKQFVLENKNNVVQAGKVIEMISKIKF